MKSKSLKKNFVLYLVRIMSGVLFSIMVFPYVSRVLGPESVGKVQYAESIVAYFILFVNLGIPAYGAREISIKRNDKFLKSKLTLEMLIILFVNTIITIVIYFILRDKIEFLRSETELFFIFLIYIILNFLDLEWFYRGIEDQQYITTRAVIFKILSIFPILYFLKASSDYKIYAFILVITLSGANIFNLYRLFKYVEFKDVYKKIELKKHLKPLLLLFSSGLAASIFHGLDTIMIGSLVGIQAVGFYGVASKLGAVPLTFITAISRTVSPRLSYYLGNNDKKSYYELANNSLDYILLFCIPATVGLYFLAPQIILTLSGEAYTEAIITLKIFSFIVIVLGLALFTGGMIYIPHKLEKKYMISLFGGAILNLIFNYIFIPIYKQNGAAVGTILAEGSAVVIRIILAREIFKEINLFDKNKLKIIFASSIMGMYLYFLPYFVEKNINVLIVGIIMGAFIYFSCLLLLKEKNIFEIYREKIKKNKMGEFQS